MEIETETGLSLYGFAPLNDLLFSMEVSNAEKINIFELKEGSTKMLKNFFPLKTTNLQLRY